MLAFSKHDGQLLSINAGPRGTLKSWNLERLGSELAALGISTPEAIFGKPSQTHTVLARSPSSPFTVQRNWIFDELAIEQLMYETESALHQNQWQPAWQLRWQALQLQLKHFRKLSGDK